MLQIPKCLHLHNWFVFRYFFYLDLNKDVESRLEIGAWKFFRLIRSIRAIRNFYNDKYIKKYGYTKNKV